MEMPELLTVQRPQSGFAQAVPALTSEGTATPAEPLSAHTLMTREGTHR